MTDLSPLWSALSGGGIVLIREVWTWAKTRRSPEELAAKDRLIAVHEAEIKRLNKELWNGQNELRRRDEERDRTVGVAARMRMDSQIDEAEFEADLPTEIRRRVELVAPKSSMAPPGIPDKKRLPAGAGRDAYRGLSVDEITPTAVAPPMTGRGRLKP